MKALTILIVLIFYLPQLVIGQINLIPGIGFQASTIERQFNVGKGNGVSIGKFNVEYQLNPSFSIGLSSRFAAEYYLIQSTDSASDVLRIFDIEYINVGTGLIFNYWMNDDWELNLGYSIDRLRSLDIKELTFLETGINILNTSKDVHVAELGMSYYATRHVKLFAMFRFRSVTQKGQVDNPVDNLIREYYAFDFGGQYKIPLKIDWRIKAKVKRPKKSMIGCPE